jgi:hypothetical protein
MTPLTAMRGYLETLAMPELSIDGATRERYLRIIDEETRRLERIIGDRPRQRSGHSSRSTAAHLQPLLQGGRRADGIWRQRSRPFDREGHHRTPWRHDRGEERRGAVFELTLPGVPVRAS